MSQHISHLLKAESHANGNNVFSLPADTSAADSHVRSRLTPLTPCNFPRITGEAATTRESNTNSGASFEGCEQVQEKFKGSRVSFLQLAVLLLLRQVVMVDGYDFELTVPWLHYP